MSENMDALQKHLKMLQDDVKGSYKSATEQIKFVKGGLDKLKEAVRFQGCVTLIAAAVIAVATGMIFKHADKLEKANQAITTHDSKIRDEQWIESKANAIAEKLAKKYQRKDKEILDLAKKLDLTEAAVKKLALGEADKLFKKVPARRSNDEIKKIAIDHNRTNAEIRKIAVQNNRTDKEIEALANNVAAARDKKLPKRRTDQEIEKISAQVAAARDKKLPKRRTDQEITDLAKATSDKTVSTYDSKLFKKLPTTINKHAPTLQNFEAHKQATIKGFDTHGKSLERHETRLKKLEKSLEGLVKNLETLSQLNKQLETRMGVLAKLAARNSTQKISLGKLQLAGLDFSKINFAKTTLSKIDFKKSNLQGASFKGSLLDNVDFSGADLRGVDLRCEGVKNLKAKGAVYDSKTKFDKALIDLAKLGAKKK